MRVLGIETSCDETAAAVVASSGANGGEILSNIVYSQIDEHAEFGGVVPEIAARAHLAKLDWCIEKALQASGSKWSDIDAIAVTAGPGLIGGLLTGLMTAKGLSLATGLPFYPINHLEGHALTPRLTDGISFPYLLLLVSGGHSQFVSVNEVGDYRRLASTIDDALGEAFDKTAKLLSLGYPGGPAVEAWAKRGDAGRFALPRAMAGKTELNLSFSGLKTAVRQIAQKEAPLSEETIADICASFQAAVTDILCDRTAKLIDWFEQEHPQSERTLVIAGGVAANKTIRNGLETVCAGRGWKLFAPPQALCTDNAAMIAWAGLERIGRFPPGEYDIAPRSRWPLDETSSSMVGTGKRGAKV